MALARDFKMAIRLTSGLTLLIIVLAALQWGLAELAGEKISSGY
jgi:hypothetical protein